MRLGKDRVSGIEKGSGNVASALKTEWGEGVPWNSNEFPTMVDVVLRFDRTARSQRALMSARDRGLDDHRSENDPERDTGDEDRSAHAVVMSPA